MVSQRELRGPVRSVFLFSFLSLYLPLLPSRFGQEKPFILRPAPHGLVLFGTNLAFGNLYPQKWILPEFPGGSAG